MLPSRIVVLTAVASLVAALSARAAEPAGVPAVPYRWRNVAIGGGGFVTGIVAHPRERGLGYARTDVGGAYRWDATAQRWVPLNDDLSEADANLLGIESLAIDPADPQRLYLAAGTYGRGKAAILRSADQGRTFQRTDVPIALGGNEAGRFAGERLAVDPNDGRILFFGSRADGLWRSDDRGASWARVDGFPVRGAEPEFVAGPPNAWWNQPVGTVAVGFAASTGHRGAPTPVVYAAVSSTGTNLYRSTDAGATWTAVPGQPTGLRPNHLVVASDGVLYLSYGKEPGPGQMTDGAVWRFDPARAGWTDITPLHPADAGQPFGYGCVTVDAANPAILLATTFTHWRPHDFIYRSTDRGATWRQLWEDDRLQWDHARAPYTATRGPHWLGTIVLNPFDPDQAWVTTGYGVWASRDLRAADADQPTHWEFRDEGLEETVPLALLSPAAGPHLISGVGDLDGFRHDQLDQSPAAGSFAGPRVSSTRDLAGAGAHPEIVGRIGNAGRGTFVHAMLSTDGARTWQALAQDAPGGSDGLGRIALNADGSVFLWATDHGGVHRTENRGETWTACGGVPSPVSVAADPADAARFYAFEPKTGRLFASADRGRTFTVAATFPPAAERDRSEVLATVPGRPGELWVGSRTLGLFRSTDAAAHFTKVARVETADAVGFGRPAVGRTHPTVFLRGKVAGRPAFYRSEDEGATWVRINDDAHQFGAANRPLIVGDPRVYGRVYLTTGGRGILYGDPAPAP